MAPTPLSSLQIRLKIMKNMVKLHSILDTCFQKLLLWIAFVHKMIILNMLVESNYDADINGQNPNISNIGNSTQY
jgi:hypothetical protein